MAHPRSLNKASVSIPKRRPLAPVTDHMRESDLHPLPSSMFRGWAWVSNYGVFCLLGGRGAPVVNESAPLKVEVQTVMLKERFRQAKKRRESRRWGSWHRFIGNGNKRDHF